MTEAQQTALAYPCRLAVETLHPRFQHKSGLHNVVLTMNTGYEWIEQQFGGPVWHSSTSMAPGWAPDQHFLRQAARKALQGVGDAALGEWTEWNAQAGVYHLKRRLSAREQEVVGDACDIRGTEEAVQRRAAMEPYIPVWMKGYEE